MRNLVDNSLHYGDEVQISAKIKDETLKIIIDDNGIGISPQQRDNIFKPFYRIDDSRNLDKESEESPGAGLGLSIVMDVVNSHGGRIKADESPKKGLRMTIYLPI
jgi:two-component system osmolarity sensor histidine kinase EnvZ